MEGRDRTQTTPDLENVNGARLKTNEEKGQALLGRFIEQSNQNNLHKRKHILSDLNSTLTESGPDDEITEYEFNESFKRSGKDTTPGPVTVQYSDIMNLTEEDMTELHAIYQERFDKGYIPEDWTHSFLQPILTPEKDHRKLNGYRSLHYKTPPECSWNASFPGNSTETSRTEIYFLRIRVASDRGNVHMEMQLHVHYDVYEGFQ